MGNPKRSGNQEPSTLVINWLHCRDAFRRPSTWRCRRGQNWRPSWGLHRLRWKSGSRIAGLSSKNFTKMVKDQVWNTVLITVTSWPAIHRPPHLTGKTAEAELPSNKLFLAARPRPILRTIINGLTNRTNQDHIYSLLMPCTSRHLIPCIKWH